MLLSLSLVLSAGFSSAASIAPVKRQSPPATVLVGLPNTVLVTDFDGLNFNLVANSTLEGTIPSWMAFREPNLLYVVDQNSTNTRLFNVSPHFSLSHGSSTVANSSTPA